MSSSIQTGSPQSVIARFATVCAQVCCRSGQDSMNARILTRAPLWSASQGWQCNLAELGGAVRLLVGHVLHEVGLIGPAPCRPSDPAGSEKARQAFGPAHVGFVVF